MSNPNFKDPYEALPENALHRTTILVDGRDKAFVFSCHNRRGTLQTTINILLNRLVKQLKANGLTEYDPDRYEELVGNALIVFFDERTTIIPGSTPAVPTGQAADRDDGCGVTGVAREGTRTPLEPPDAAGAPASKRTGRRTVRKVKQQA